MRQPVQAGKRFCPLCLKTLANDEIVKGYQGGKNMHLVLTDEDFQKARLLDITVPRLPNDEMEAISRQLQKLEVDGPAVVIPARPGGPLGKAGDAM